MSEFLKKHWFPVAFITLNGFALLIVGAFHLGTLHRDISQIPDVAEKVNEIPVIAKRLDNVEARLDNMETRLDRLESRLDRLEDKLDRALDRLNTLPSTYQNTIYTPQPQQ